MTQAYQNDPTLYWSAETAAQQGAPQTAAAGQQSWPSAGADAQLAPQAALPMGRGGLDISNPVSMEATINPMTNAEAYGSSIKSLLARNTGYFIVATFQTGTDSSVVWQGILHTVGSDYIVIYQPEHDRYISGDLYALKFVEFHNSRTVPYHAAANQWCGRRL